MNTRVVVVASCLLLSMPVFAEGLIYKHLMKSKHHSVVKNLKPSDFSGVWVGPCNMLQEQVTLKIIQTDKNIALSFPDERDDDGNKVDEFVIKFPIDQVKSRVVSSLHSMEHSLSYTSWMSPDEVGLSYYGIGEGANYGTYTNYKASLVLENGKLKFIGYGNPENIVCVLDKQS